MKSQDHILISKENEGRVDAYFLAPGISISYNQIYTGSWTKGDSSVFSGEMLILNFCVGGRCDASLTGDKYAIVKERQVCISTCVPTKDFYYPGRMYEGIQFYIDRAVLRQTQGKDFLSLLGVEVEQIVEMFCGENGLYLHRMNDALYTLVKDAWKRKEEMDLPMLRYLVVRMLHEVMGMPCESEPEMYFTRSQIAMVKEAESIILQDLSQRIPAKEMAERFGVSESSFKLYVKGILGDSYLSYFRRKRMERAAELLETTNWKVIDIANAVGYENQGKFAKVFAEEYGVSPLEFRRLSK